MPTMTERLRDQLVDAAVRWRAARAEARLSGATTIPVAVNAELEGATLAYEESLTLDIPVASGARETSRQAALLIAPRAGTLRDRIMHLVFSAEENGLTCQEAEDALQRAHQTVSPRFNELYRGGWIKDSGKRQKARSGVEQIVWWPTEVAVDIYTKSSAMEVR